MVNLVAEEDHLPLRNVDAAEQSGIAGGAAQAQVGFGLEVLGEGGFELVSKAVLIWTSKFMPPRKPVRVDAVRTGSADFASSEPTSASVLKPARRMVMVPRACCDPTSRSDSSWRPRWC